MSEAFGLMAMVSETFHIETFAPSVNYISLTPPAENYIAFVFFKYSSYIMVKQYVAYPGVTISEPLMYYYSTTGDVMIERATDISIDATSSVLYISTGGASVRPYGAIIY